MMEEETRIPPVDVETLPNDLRETLEEQRKRYGVIRFDTEWRARRDSNARPLASEANTLSN